MCSFILPFSPDTGKYILGKYQFYSADFTSLEPKISAGDLILIKMTDHRKIGVGDMIAFDAGDGTLAIKEVCGISWDAKTNKNIYFLVKDNLSDESVETVKETRLVGCVRKSLPRLGSFFLYVADNRILFITVAFIFCAALIVLAEILDRKKRKATDSDSMLLVRAGEEEAEAQAEDARHLLFEIEKNPEKKHGSRK